LFDWLPIIGVIAIVLVIAVTTNFLIAPTTIIDRQTALQKQIFSKILDAKLYSTFNGRDFTRIKILTNYPVQYLPGFEQSEVSFYYNDLVVFNSEMKDGTIGYLLVPVYANSDIQDAIQNLLQEGNLKFPWEDHGWIEYSMYELVRKAIVNSRNLYREHLRTRIDKPKSLHEFLIPLLVHHAFQFDIEGITTT